MNNNKKIFGILKLISTLIILALLSVGGYFGYQAYKAKELQKEQAKATLENITKDSSNDDSPLTPSDDVNLGIDWSSVIDKSKDSNPKDTTQTQPTQEPKISPNPANTKTPSKPQGKKPYLAIIMDDMAYPNQAKELLALKLTITPSFFPVSADSKDTAKLAALFPFYMVHLPLEAQQPQHSRHKWLTIGSNIQDIQNYIGAIKKDFPQLNFINNHTGSKFTASLKDMQNLLYVMNEYGIDFVDSRTTPDTKAPFIYKQSARPLLYRDVFLDNEQNTNYILKQLQEALAIAKKRGYAIAICHPHPATFAALKKAKQNLLNQVELVYIKDLPITKNRPKLHIVLDSKLTSDSDLADSDIHTKPSDNASLSDLIPESTKSSDNTSSKSSDKASSIDYSMFEEASKMKNTPPPKTLQTSQNPQDCSQSSIEAFVSGCLPKGTKSSSQTNGFIEMEWTSTKASASQKSKATKPKDFIEIEE